MCFESLSFWCVALLCITKCLWGTKSCGRWDLQPGIDFHVIIWSYLRRACAGDGWGTGQQWPHCGRSSKRCWQWWQIPAALRPLIIRHSATGWIIRMWESDEHCWQYRKYPAGFSSRVSLCFRMQYDDRVGNLSVKSSGNSTQRFYSG